MDPAPHSQSGLRYEINRIIYGTDTYWGKTFDVILLVMIVLSVITVMMETVQDYGVKYHTFFLTVEWIFTIFFTIEYALRIISTKQPRKYIFSFFGIIDFLAILPAYLSLFLFGAQYLLVIRALRLLRIFRVFKLAHFLSEGAIITKALKASRAKIIVFLMFVLVADIIFGSIMYLVEANADSGFTSIPESIYWAIVTMTTVGYGDISPKTPLGQFIASVIMMLGYAVIAVPTGIVSSEFVMEQKDRYSNKKSSKKNKKKAVQECKECGNKDHDHNAAYCKMCGTSIIYQ